MCGMMAAAGPRASEAILFLPQNIEDWNGHRREYSGHALVGGAAAAVCRAAEVPGPDLAGEHSDIGFTGEWVSEAGGGR